jgi:hypothetical protein
VAAAVAGVTKAAAAASHITLHKTFKVSSCMCCTHEWQVALYAFVMCCGADCQWLDAFLAPAGWP